jgi:hypothetical protein
MLCPSRCSQAARGANDTVSNDRRMQSRGCSLRGDALAHITLKMPEGSVVKAEHGETKRHPAQAMSFARRAIAPGCPPIPQSRSKAWLIEQPRAPHWWPFASFEGIDVDIVLNEADRQFRSRAASVLDGRGTPDMVVRVQASHANINT